MSLLANFDLVTEISNAALRKLIRKNMKIGNVPANPPFELTLSLGEGLPGSVHIIVNDLQLDLNANNSLTLQLSFERTSAMIQSPTLTLCPLAGTISATIPLSLVGSGNIRQLTALTTLATVTIKYTSQSEQTIKKNLSSFVDLKQFKNVVTQMVTDYLRSVPDTTLPMSFNVVPGVNGSISPLQYSSLQLHCIANADRNKQALTLCGNLLAATQNNGDPQQKTSTSIAPNRDTAVSIAPGAFHSLFFCPSMAKALQVQVNQLPTNCGGAGAFSQMGVDITSLVDSFAEGHINFDGTAQKSGPCYDVHGSFHAEITLSVSGGKLVPNFTLNDPKLDVSIAEGFWCWTANVFTFGTMGSTILFIVAKIVEAVFEDYLEPLLKSVLSSLLGSGFGSIGLGGFSGASFQSVTITQEGINLQGLVPMFVAASKFHPQTWFVGSVTTSSKEVLSTGVWHTSVPCPLPTEAKDYPYTEYAQSQTATFDILSSMLAVPLQPLYKLSKEDGSGSVDLTKSQDTITIADVKNMYMMPLGNGGSEVTQSVEISYEISDSLVQLKMVQPPKGSKKPQYGKFSLKLSASVQDCAGQALPGTLAEVSDLVVFEGNNIEMGGSYLEDYQSCMAFYRDFNRRNNEISKKYAHYTDVPIWVQVNYPSPERVIEQIRVLASLGVPQVEDLLIHTRAAHGSSFARAIYAPASAQLGMAKTTPRQLQALDRSVAIQQQIDLLTAELADLQQDVASIAPNVTRLKMPGR